MARLLERVVARLLEGWWLGCWKGGVEVARLLVPNIYAFKVSENMKQNIWQSMAASLHTVRSQTAAVGFRHPSLEERCRKALFLECGRCQLHVAAAEVTASCVRKLESGQGRATAARHCFCMF